MSPLPAVVSVSRSTKHTFSKVAAPSIRLIEGLGVEGDAHAGTTTQHRHLLKKDPTRPNFTQVHLIASELFDELAQNGFEVGPGQLGENVTTSGIDLISLPLGTRLRLGDEAIVAITGLRSPCSLINKLQNGLMKACIGRDEDGTVILKAGIMSVVVRGGTVSADDGIAVELPLGAPVPLGIV